MRVRDEGCRACSQTTGGDCGGHGRLTILDTFPLPTVPPTPTPSPMVGQRKWCVGPALHAAPVNELPVTGGAMTEREHQACPCLHVEPCDPRCTCRNQFSSKGCTRCCSYGSVEQQRAMAQTLADRDAYIARLMEALRQIALLANHAPWVCEDIADTALADAGAGKERGDE